MPSVYDRTLQESTLFELFESDAYSDTLKALKVAQIAMLEQLASFPDDELTKSRLIAIRKVIDEQIALAYVSALPTLQKELPQIALLTAENLLLSSFVKVPTNVIDTITSNSFEVQGYKTKELFKTISDNHSRQLRVLVGSGVARGKSASQIAKELTTKHTALSGGQLKNAIFTTTTEARAVSRHDSYSKMEGNGIIKGYEYVATLDGRTTQYCRNHDGRRYYKPIHEIESEINVHFNCRSIFVPITKSTKKTERASQFGPVPDETYSQWFKKQSDSFQKTVLGKKYSSYKSGTYIIGGLPDVLGVTLSLAAIAKALKEAKDLTEEEQKNLNDPTFNP